MHRDVKLELLLTILFLGGCSAPGTTVGIAPALVKQPLAASRPAVLPAVLLYVLGGARTSRHPDIEVFDGTRHKPGQKPLYTIPSRRSGEYGLLVVDEKNNLYATNAFYNAVELDMFPSGQTKPTIQCTFASKPQGAYTAGNTLYIATSSFTIEEYALPLHAGKNCPKPTKILTDQRAKLRGQFFFGVAVDSAGDVFDTWQSGQGEEFAYIDEFLRGSRNARRYAPLRQSFDYLIASDTYGNLAANVTPNGVGEGNDIAIFPYGARRPHLYDPLSNGQYLGFAFADHDTELFTVPDYPEAAVEVYAYDARTATVGALLGTYSTGVWYYAGSIAVYTKP